MSQISHGGLVDRSMINIDNQREALVGAGSTGADGLTWDYLTQGGVRDWGAADGAVTPQQFEFKVKPDQTFLLSRVIFLLTDTGQGNFATFGAMAALGVGCRFFFADPGGVLLDKKDWGTNLRRIKRNIDLEFALGGDNVREVAITGGPTETAVMAIADAERTTGGKVWEMPGGTRLIWEINDLLTLVEGVILVVGQSV
jgi:hypothetical protein